MPKGLCNSAYAIQISPNGLLLLKPNGISLHYGFALVSSGLSAASIKLSKGQRGQVDGCTEYFKFKKEREMTNLKMKHPPSRTAAGAKLTK